MLLITLLITTFSISPSATELSPKSSSSVCWVIFPSDWVMCIPALLSWLFWRHPNYPAGSCSLCATGLVRGGHGPLPAPQAQHQQRGFLPTAVTNPDYQRETEPPVHKGRKEDDSQPSYQQKTGSRTPCAPDSKDASVSWIKQRCCVVVAQSLSHVRLFATLWTVAWQAPLSMGYWSGLQFLTPGDIPDPGM